MEHHPNIMLQNASLHHTWISYNLFPTTIKLQPEIHNLGHANKHCKHLESQITISLQAREQPTVHLSCIYNTN